MESETLDLYEEEAVHDEEEISIDDLESQYWFKEFDRDFLGKPGGHLLGIGITGSGKTQKAYYLVKKLLEYETIIWFDSGKSYALGKYEEIAPLFNFGVPVNIIVPIGVEMKIENSPVPVSYDETIVGSDIWDKIKPGYINIISLTRFFLMPELYGKYCKDIFLDLIQTAMSNKKRLSHLIPIAIFYDEFSDLAPSKNLTVQTAQFNIAQVISFNITKLRSFGIRFCAFTQAYQNIFPAVRLSFNWVLACRGTYLKYDEPVIRNYNPLHSTLEIPQAVLWWPDRSFHGVWRFSLFHSPENIKITSSGIRTSL
jgi:hypothetical protein